MEPTWVLSAPDGPHVGPMNLAIRLSMKCQWKLIDIAAMNSMNAGYDQFDNPQEYSGGNAGNPQVTVYPQGQRYNAQPMNNFTVVVDKPNYPWCTLVTSVISVFFCTVGELWGQTKWLPFYRRHLELHFHQWRLYLWNSLIFCLINNKTFVQILAWRRKGDKSLSQFMLAYCTDTYKRQSSLFNESNSEDLQIGICQTSEPTRNFRVGLISNRQWCRVFVIWGKPYCHHLRNTQNCMEKVLWFCRLSHCSTIIHN